MSRTGRLKNSFSTREAATVTGVSHRTVDYWARTKLIVPSIADAHGVGTDRTYSFDDLLALHAARELREAGISTRMLRLALEHLRARGYPKRDCRLVGVGSRVCIVRKGQLEDALTGQGMFAFVLDLNENRKAVMSEVNTLIARAVA
jgi:DNA-binding transcriptional MerR regulator